MISLKRIVEQAGADGLYDLGRDFANFRRTIDGSSDQIKKRFEQVIGEKLNGKRVRARASRGYKQYIKDYEFDVTKVTLDDYYDNYVVVAHDNTTPKPKEYFLKPGFKIQILGPASGQPSVGGKGGYQPTSPTQAAPAVSPTKAQAAPMQPVGQPKPALKEHGTGFSDAYSKDQQVQDVKSWLPRILKKPDTSMMDFIKGLGWLKSKEHGSSVAIFDLKLPVSELRIRPTADILTKLVQSANKLGSTISTTFHVKDIKPDVDKGIITVRVVKTMKDTTL
jgi:hypothetical protein